MAVLAMGQAHPDASFRVALEEAREQYRAAKVKRKELQDEIAMLDDRILKLRAIVFSLSELLNVSVPEELRVNR